MFCGVGILIRVRVEVEKLVRMLFSRFSIEMIEVWVRVVVMRCVEMYRFGIYFRGIVEKIWMYYNRRVDEVLRYFREEEICFE